MRDAPVTRIAAKTGDAATTYDAEQAEIAEKRFLCLFREFRVDRRGSEQ
jgi:hypothetical protein